MSSAQPEQSPQTTNREAFVRTYTDQYIEAEQQAQTHALEALGHTPSADSFEGLHGSEFSERSTENFTALGSLIRQVHRHREAVIAREAAQHVAGMIYDAEYGNSRLYWPGE